MDKERENTKPQNNIKRVIAVMSGKGGVGKSSITALLALSLAKKGYNVGIMDADITGPSIPKIFGVTQTPRSSDYGAVPPKTNEGISIMSFNLLLPEDDEPVIWRGPLIANAIKQFWSDIYWGDLDYLLVDLPPGTGDAPLTVMQSLPLDGVVIVTSPQDLANMVVRKAIKMATKMNINIIGLVENMSFVICPDCGKKIEIFGTGKAVEKTKNMGVSLLSVLPLSQDFAEACDRGDIEKYQGNLLDLISPVIDTITA